MNGSSMKAISEELPSQCLLRDSLS